MAQYCQVHAPHIQRTRHSNMQKGRGGEGRIHLHTALPREVVVHVDRLLGELLPQAIAPLVFDPAELGEDTLAATAAGTMWKVRASSSCSSRLSVSVWVQFLEGLWGAYQIDLFVCFVCLF